MTKSWKKLIKTTDLESTNENKNSFSNIQLTLHEIASQNQELDELLKERESLENEMGDLLHAENPAEDPRFSSNIESFKYKREKEKNRAAQKRKLEERILRKNKELEKWEQNQKRLKEKLALQKKSLQKKGTEQDPSTSQKALTSKTKSSDRKWFDTNSIRKKKDVIERKKKVLTEKINQVENVSEKIRNIKTKSDLFGQKDLVKFQKKLDEEKKNTVIPIRIQRIKDDWDEKRENQKEKLKEKLKEKIESKKLSERLDEVKRFTQLSKQNPKDSMESVESKIPEIKELTKTLENNLSLTDRQNNLSENATAKKAEQKETELKDAKRREKQREQLISKKRTERKEEERSNKMKERKKDKYT